MQDQVKAIQADFVKEIGNNGDFYVVYLDDEDAFFPHFTKVISGFGLKALTTTSSSEALSYIQKFQNRIVLVISDINMPVMNGLEFREQVLKVASSLPFAILSGYVDRETALRGLELKICAFIDKPIEGPKLADLFSKEALPRIQQIKEEAELLQGFISEAKSLVDDSEELLLVLEQEPSDLDSLNKFFGIIHTIKGSSSFFEPKTLHHFAHRFEEILKKIQRREIVSTPLVISSLLRGIDIIKELIEDFGQTEHKKFDLDALLAELKPVEESKPGVVDDPVTAKATAAVGVKQNEVKVPISILDEFMQTSGEMTVIRNMLNKCVRSIEKQYPTDKEIGTLVELLEELHKVNGDVQVKVNELRKVALKNIIKPMHRAVRDVAAALKKEVSLEVQGEGLRVDTAIADVLSNCLLHLVKNSIDHGLEMPAERVAAGKSSSGSVSIRSYIKSDHVFVEIEDDGKGIDSNRIKKKMLENKTHSQDEIELMSDEDIYAMIFEPGLSTAQVVTDISGRGVGMSMVKSTVVSAGGTIKINSQWGQGTKMTLDLPVPKSVLITNCLFIKCGLEQFGILEENITRVLRIPHEQIANEIRCLEGSEFICVEGELLAIADIETILGSGEALKVSDSKDDLNLVILTSPDHAGKLALRVEEILEIEDTVIKSLQYHVNLSGLYRGATFLGDRRLGLILNSSGIFEKAYGGMSSKAIRGKINVASETKLSGARRDGVLLCELNRKGVYGIPQETVYRIEELDISKATPSGDSLVIVYRNQLLTLIDMSKVVQFHSERSVKESVSHIEIERPIEPEKSSVVIVECKNKLVGLLFKSVWDVAQLERVTESGFQFGSEFSAHYLYQDKVVSLLNIEEILATSVLSRAS